MRPTLILSAILLMASVAEAAAACKKSDLNGRWSYFALANVTDSDGIVLFVLTEDCRFVIDDAEFTKVSCGGGGSDIPGDLRDEFFGAEIQLAKNCRLEITGARFCDYFGQISRDKLTGSGVAFCQGFDRLSFGLVKR
jgi:hypothetical protein